MKTDSAQIEKMLMRYLIVSIHSFSIFVEFRISYSIHLSFLRI